MRWQAAAALAAAAFAAGDFAAAAIAASGANPILDPEAAMAALRAGRAFSTEALPLCAGTACACARAPRLGALPGVQRGPARRRGAR